VTNSYAALLGSADTLPALTGKLVTGGRLNVARALQQVTNLDATPIVIYASPAGWRANPQAPITATFSRPMDQEASRPRS
jgi:hypothetical protein